MCFWEQNPMTAEAGATLYRPSHGTEGIAFTERWCGSCLRDAAFRADEGDSCLIVAMTMALEVSDPDYPREWIMGERGPICTAWEPMPDDGTGRLEDIRQGEMRL